MVNSRFGRFLGLLFASNALTGALLALVYKQMVPEHAAEQQLLQQSFLTVFFIFLIVSGVISWLFLLAHESRIVAQMESNRQTRKLMREIEAHKLTDMELQSAKEIAERANDAKSRYLSGISHELRTPLQSILGYAQLLSDKPALDDSMTRGLNIIHRSGQHLADLIEGLLDISKIEAGKLDLYRTQVQLPELLDQLVSMFKMQAQTKGLTFSYKVNGSLPNVVIGDEKRLRQILTNLLSNACKYTEQGTIEFDVSYRYQVAEFTIKDSGPGIDESYLSRIFDPFERVRNQHTPNVQGTGLGLTIVKLLTEIMGGDLDVKSVLNEGSVFKVTLMLPSVDADEKEESSVDKVVGYEGYQRTIYIVDDDPVLRGFLSDLLIPLGFHTLEAHDAESCLALVEKGEPDLFLMDVSMPGMTGLELAEELRKKEVSAPILMLSANAVLPVDSVSSAPLAKTYNDYLVKPINNGTLLDKIAHHLSLSWIMRNGQKDAAVVDVTQEYAPDSDVPHNSDVSDTEFAVPDHALIRELKVYAEMGHPKGVSQTLEQIQEEQLLSNEHIALLKDLSQGFQFEQLVRKLEPEEL